MRALFCSLLVTAVCDGLVHKFRRCAARFAPQELAGPMRWVRHWATSEQARPCKVLRPMFDALWPESCEWSAVRGDAWLVAWSCCLPAWCCLDW